MPARPPDNFASEQSLTKKENAIMTSLKNLGRRDFALFIALTMCLSLMNITAFAEEVEDADSGSSIEYTERSGRREFRQQRRSV